MQLLYSSFLAYFNKTTMVWVDYKEYIESGRNSTVYFLRRIQRREKSPNNRILRNLNRTEIYIIGFLHSTMRTAQGYLKNVHTQTRFYTSETHIYFITFMYVRF